mmetsp:Transcript_26907/g.60715  ORF Transcript_26907/g.60715 Transcript_26907/m.60715 type:complete len:260 (-) Transcript_26907:1102-1881(-)
MEPEPLFVIVLHALGHLHDSALQAIGHHEPPVPHPLLETQNRQQEALGTSMYDTILLTAVALSGFLAERAEQIHQLEGPRTRIGVVHLKARPERLPIGDPTIRAKIFTLAGWTEENLGLSGRKASRPHSCHHSGHNLRGKTVVHLALKHNEEELPVVPPSVAYGTHRSAKSHRSGPLGTQCGRWAGPAHRGQLSAHVLRPSCPSCPHPRTIDPLHEPVPDIHGGHGQADPQHEVTFIVVRKAALLCELIDCRMAPPLAP